LSELADAIAQLERAVARLEMAAARGPRRGEDEQVATAAAAIGGRVDAALAKLDQLLEKEGT
jgi:thiamine pyrophosphokinase